MGSSRSAMYHRFPLRHSLRTWPFRVNLDLKSDRAKRDAELRAEMTRVWDDKQSVYVAFVIDTFANKIVG